MWCESRCGEERRRVGPRAVCDQDEGRQGRKCSLGPRTPPLPTPSPVTRGAPLHLFAVPFPRLMARVRPPPPPRPARALPPDPARPVAFPPHRYGQDGLSLKTWPRVSLVVRLPFAGGPRATTGTHVSQARQDGAGRGGARARLGVNAIGHASEAGERPRPPPPFSPAPYLAPARLPWYSNAI